MRSQSAWSTPKHAERFIELLSKPNVLERLGLEAWQIKDLGRVGVAGAVAAGEHRTDRRERAKEKAADLAMRDLQRRVESIEESERARRVVRRD